MSTRNIVKNIRSKELVDGKPKLPTSSQLDYGEIAVNYKEGYETLSLKNDKGNIVSLSVNTIEDVKVNEASVVANKTANITMKGNTIPVSGGQYSPMIYPKPFDGKAQQILADKKLSEALKILETNISALVTEVLDNEETSAAAIRKLAESAGTVDGSGNIGYQKAAGTHYISDAGSVHNATVILDSNLNNLRNDANSMNSSISSLESTINDLQTAIDNLQGSIGQSSTVEWVDLGLPSGLKWAKCNVGAKNETDYGSYFQWGDIMNKTNSKCDWINYKHCNGSSTTLTKYTATDNKTTLDPEDDAVSQFMGSNWRMPTKAEFAELYNNTTKEQITNYKGSGVNGWKFTHQTDSSKYIFIPASGARSDSGFYGRGRSGEMWSSSLDTESPSDAWHLYFDSRSVHIQNGNSRDRGFVVRGVCTLPL